MGSLEDDLRAALGAASQVAAGLCALDRAPTQVLGKVDGVVEHFSDASTVERVATAGVVAVVTAAAREVQVGAARPPKPPAPTPGVNLLHCKHHGDQPWKGTIVCTACGQVYQVLDAHSPRHAPQTCVCRVRLLPPKPFSAEMMCSVCFVEIAAGTGIAHVARRSS
jgi:hypothetical protein